MRFLLKTVPPNAEMPKKRTTAAAPVQLPAAPARAIYKKKAEKKEENTQTEQLRKKTSDALQSVVIKERSANESVISADKVVKSAGKFLEAAIEVRRKAHEKYAGAKNRMVLANEAHRIVMLPAGPARVSPYPARGYAAAETKKVKQQKTLDALTNANIKETSAKNKFHEADKYVKWEEKQFIQPKKNKADEKHVKCTEKSK